MEQLDNKERQQTYPKQVIVVRKDLQMPSGKLGAQVAHASMAALFKCGEKTDTTLHIDLEKDSAIEQWLNGRFTKIIVYVKSETKLINIAEKAEEKGLPTALIKDAGFTVFNEPTYTCVGIGPAFPKDFIGITDKLRVL